MNTRIDPDFAALLSSRFQVEELDRNPSSVVGLWPDSRLAYVNPAWIAFAVANDGQPAVEESWGLGARYLDAIAPPLRPFYQGLLQSALDTGTSLRPVSHRYECSSAEVERHFNMQVYPLPAGAGFVIVNSLLAEEPHDPAARPPQPADPVRYVDPHGRIVQCCHCRLVRRTTEPTQWDWVPAWVERSPIETSHSICPVCMEYYYPEHVEDTA